VVLRICFQQIDRSAMLEKASMTIAWKLQTRRMAVSLHSTESRMPISPSVKSS